MRSRRDDFAAAAFAAVAVLSSLPLYAGVEEAKPTHELYGAYCVTDIERHRGGLTSHDQAHSHRHATVMLRENDFLFWDGTHYLNPTYDMKDHLVSAQEGHIPDGRQRFGTFYGFGLERDIVTTLSVHELSGQQPPYVFEVMGSQLWFFLDGWFYKLEKALSVNAHICNHATT